MKNLLVALIILSTLILGVGCSTNNVNDVEVHTEEEMKSFALQALKEKYDKEFEFKEDLTYSHEDDNIMYLNGHAHVIGDESLECYFEVTEPNKFKDNYASNYYKEEIKEYLKPSLKGISNEYEIFVAYNINNKVFNPKMDFQKYLYDSNCTIYYTAYVEETDDFHSYIPIIRQWMKVLYKAEYDWQFELKDVEHKERYYYTLSPVDNGFDSEKDWKDETIYDDICFLVDVLNRDERI